MRRQHYVVVVPVKSPTIGKSRLRVPDHARPGLASAFALDVLEAAERVRFVTEVVVMTADGSFAQRCGAMGIRTVPDGEGLNDGLRKAAGRLRVQAPDAFPVALCADLPCLTPGDLTAALSAVTGEHPWFCADTEGTGTTLYTAPYDEFEPRFGEGSRRAHERAGARPLPGALATLRRDVDDEVALEQAVRLGTGSHTTVALQALVP